LSCTYAEWVGLPQVCQKNASETARTQLPGFASVSITSRSARSGVATAASVLAGGAAEGCFDRATLISWSHIMKTTLLFCSTLALSTAFAADFPTGTFEGKQTPFTVSFDDNGQFRVKQGDTLEVKGSYSATGSELKLSDAEGPWACTKAGEQTGTYTWKYENAVLTFVKLSDKCEDRVQSLVGPAWQRQK
jgi:hypothetical protein